MTPTHENVPDNCSDSDGPPRSLAPCTLEQLSMCPTLSVSLSLSGLRAALSLLTKLRLRVSSHQRRRPEARLDQSELSIPGRTALSRLFPAPTREK